MEFLKLIQVAERICLERDGCCMGCEMKPLCHGEIANGNNMRAAEILEKICITYDETHPIITNREAIGTLYPWSCTDSTASEVCPKFFGELIDSSLCEKRDCAECSRWWLDHEYTGKFFKKGNKE